MVQKSVHDDTIRLYGSFADQEPLEFSLVLARTKFVIAGRSPKVGLI